MKPSKLLNIFIASLIASSSAFGADSVTMATSEDLSAFDQNIAKSRKNKPAAAQSGTSNFGASVSQKAKELKNVAGQAGGKGFGQMISEQRKANNVNGNNGNGPGSANGSGSVNSGAGAGRPENPARGGKKK